MRFDDNRVDTGGVDDLRGGGRGLGGGGGGMGGMALAGLLSMLLRGRGGKGTLLALVLLGGLLLLGGGGLFGGAGQSPLQAEGVTGAQAGTTSDLEARCNRDGAIEQYDDCLLVKAYNETDEVWSEEFQRRGMPYRAPRLAFFSGRVDTACGPATTQVGPFYCPGDQRIYFDLGFASQLRQLGVEGDYANVYIMAHEFGHHLQTITGVEQQVRQAQQDDPRNANAYGIAMELQADCYAGAWGRMADDRGNVTVTPAEVRQAQAAAQAVGDDRIQAGAGQRVNPETWTHGSAAQREQWYNVGFNSGDMARCDTFSRMG
ncbi:MAG: neutral zinc metallopeptidase [Candidatus Nanopelagicales bacterium]|jgi:predicted metalloprotease|nr:neutral zinc metallopeptidase [Candidatus Nanopelagicales bacterium]